MMSHRSLFLALALSLAAAPACDEAPDAVAVELRSGLLGSYDELDGSWDEGGKPDVEMDDDGSLNRAALLDGDLTAHYAGPHIYALSSETNEWIFVGYEETVGAGTTVIVSDPHRDVVTKIPAQPWSIQEVNAKVGGMDPWPVPPPPPPPKLGMTFDEVAAYIETRGTWPDAISDE